MSNVVDLNRPEAQGWVAAVAVAVAVGVWGGYILEKLEKTSTSHLLLAHFAGLSTTDA